MTITAAVDLVDVPLAHQHSVEPGRLTHGRHALLLHVHLPRETDADGHRRGDRLRARGTRGHRGHRPPRCAPCGPATDRSSSRLRCRGARGPRDAATTAPNARIARTVLMRVSGGCGCGIGRVSVRDVRRLGLPFLVRAARGRSLLTCRGTRGSTSGTCRTRSWSRLRRAGRRRAIRATARRRPSWRSTLRAGSRPSRTNRS